MIRRFLGISVLGGVLLALACAVNPATGKRQLVLISESDEIAMGKQYDQTLTQQMGLYPSEPLQQYVNRLGQSLAAVSERPGLEWGFRVVDDPTINAFALPGGYIYITRGILAHMNSEAELVSVLGHEIGHVTARHSVNQISKQQLAQLGFGIGLIASEGFRDFADLAQAGLGLMFLKFSRDDERQADDLGLRYLVRDGYDPRAMPGVFTMLGAVSAAQGGGRVPPWASTHPQPDNRAERIEEQIRQLQQDIGGRPINRQAYLQLLDGMIYGDDPRQGFFRDELFLHPQMQFVLRYPQGWRTVNQRQAVIGISPGQDAAVQLTLAGQPSAAQAYQAFFQQQGVQAVAPWRTRIGGYETAAAEFVVTTQQGQLHGVVAFVEYGGNVFQLLGYTVEAQWPAYRQVLAASLSSFDRLTDPAALAVEPARLRIVRASRAMGLDELARQHGSSVDVATLALINQLDPVATLQAGEHYKMVVGGELPG